MAEQRDTLPPLTPAEVLQIWRNNAPRGLGVTAEECDRLVITLNHSLATTQQAISDRDVAERALAEARLKLRGTCLLMLDKLNAIDIEVKDMIEGLNGARGPE